MPTTDPLPPYAWRDLPADRPPSRPGRPWARLVVPVVVVAVLWLVGWRELAVIVAVAAIVIGGVTAVSASARRLVERVFAAVGAAVGRFLTVVLLGLVQLVIFAPASLLAKVFRTDPLDPLARRATGSSRWVPRHPDDRRVPGRQYANERYRARAAGAVTVVGSPRWIRAAIGGLVLLLAADVALGSLLVRLDDDGDEAPAATPVFGFDPVAQEALAGQQDAAATMADLDAAGLGETDPFMGWRFPDDFVYESANVNIAAGARATAASPLGDDDPVDVWFFGGSTMYGSGQRDDTTIPSWVVRRAADDGVAIRATNYGHPAYANWQQVQLLEHHLSRGGRPDVVVFYDGFNDLTLQTQFGVHDEPTHLFFGVDPGAEEADDESVAETVRGWWSDHSAVARAYDRVADLFRDEPAIRVADTEATPIESIDPVAAADAAVAIHRRGIEHVQALGEGYGFETLFLWQPFLYTREPRTAAEEQLVGLPGYETDVWFPMTERARAGLAEPLVDLSDVLDDEPGSLFWDFVHTNEEGARLVAEAIVPLLVPMLEAG